VGIRKRVARALDAAGFEAADWVVDEAAWTSGYRIAGFDSATMPIRTTIHFAMLKRKGLANRRWRRQSGMPLRAKKMLCLKD